MPLRHALLFIAALAMGGACSPARAGDLFLDINGYSKHSLDGYKYRGVYHQFNSRNTGLGLTTGLGKYFEASAGFFDNSYGRTSGYVGAKLKHDFAHGHFRVSPGINVGVASGYQHTPVHSAALQPVLIANVRVTWRGVGATLGYLPRTNTDTGVPVSTITFQINLQLGKF